MKLRELPMRLWCLALRAQSGRARGQTTVEYMLMLATVVAMIVIFGVMFHRKIAGGFFTVVGMIIGSSAAPR